MRIFWDAYGLGERSSGVYVHAHHLAEELKPTGITPKLVGFAGFEAGFVNWPYQAFVRPAFGASVVTSKIIAPKVVAQYVAQQASLLQQPVILHGLSNINLGISPNHKFVRGVLTVHDLIPFLAPGEVSLASSLQFKFLLPAALRRAQRIICVSQWTRDTLLASYPRLDPSKVLVIPNGFPAADVSAPPVTNAKNSTIVQAMAVSRGETYKRLDLMCDIVRKSRGSVALTLVTNAQGLFIVKNRAKDLLDTQAIKVYSAQGSDQLRQLYAQADVLLHTSRYEGFCLPAAEALSAGVPVVYQSGSGIDEVVGSKVGMPLRATDKLDAWVEALHASHHKKEDPAFRAALMEHLQRMKRWKDVAEELKSAYHSLL